MYTIYRYDIRQRGTYRSVPGGSGIPDIKWCSGRIKQCRYVIRLIVSSRIHLCQLATSHYRLCVASKLEAGDVHVIHPYHWEVNSYYCSKAHPHKQKSLHKALLKLRFVFFCNKYHIKCNKSVNVMGVALAGMLLAIGLAPHNHHLELYNT